MAAGRGCLDGATSFVLAQDVVEVDLGHPGQRLGHQPRLGPGRLFVGDDRRHGAWRAPAAGSARRTRRSPGTSFASPAFSSGTMIRSKPEREAASVIASAPRTSRILPSSPSSPMIAVWRSRAVSTTPAAARRAHGDGDVVVGAGFGEGGGGEADGDLAVGELFAAVDDRGADAVAGLGQRGVREADEGGLGEALGDVGLYLDQVAFQADEGDGPCLSQRHQATPRMWSTVGAPRWGIRTATASIRISPGRSSWSRSQRPASCRRVASLR